MFYRFHRFARPAAVMLVTLGVAAGADAQSTRGELAGNVADPTGATIAGVTITAINEATGGKNVAISTSAGAYRFSALPIGTYTVTATGAGFSTASNTGVLVQINTTSSLNITLQLGTVSDVVTVDASGAQIQTESSDIGGTITAREITELPAAAGRRRRISLRGKLRISRPGHDWSGIRRGLRPECQRRLLRQDCWWTGLWSRGVAGRREHHAQ